MGLVPLEELYPNLKDRIVKVREKGYSDTQISEYIHGKVKRLRDEGRDPAQIREYLGIEEQSPNWYATKETLKQLAIDMMPPTKYLKEDVQKEYREMDKQHQVRHGLMTTLETVGLLGLGKYLEAAGGVAGGVAERFAPKAYKALKTPVSKLIGGRKEPPRVGELWQSTAEGVPRPSITSGTTPHGKPPLDIGTLPTDKPTMTIGGQTMTQGARTGVKPAISRPSGATPTIRGSARVGGQQISTGKPSTIDVGGYKVSQEATTGDMAKLPSVYKPKQLAIETPPPEYPTIKMGGQTMTTEPQVIPKNPLPPITPKESSVATKARSVFEEPKLEEVANNAYGTIDGMIEKTGKSLVSDLSNYAKTGAARGRYELTDRMVFFKLFEDEVSKLTGKKIPFDESAYAGARSYAGRPGMIEQGLKELREVVLPMRKQRPELTRYWLAKRSIERANRGFKNPNGVTKESAERELRNLGDTDRYEGMIKQIVEWSDKHILTPMKEAGVINEEAYNVIKENNKHWAPFDIIEYLPENIEGLPLGTEVFSVGKQTVVKALKGAKDTDKIVDPFETITKRLANAIQVTERNKVATKLLELGKQHPDFENIFTKLPTGKRAPKGTEPFSLFVDGKVEKYAVPKYLGDSLKHMSMAEADLLTDMAQNMNAAFRAGATTMYLPFTVSNAGRDYYFATLKSKYGFNPKMWVEGFYEAAKHNMGFNSKLFEEYLMGKGSFGWSGEFNRQTSITAKKLFESRAKRGMKIITNPLELMRRVSGTIELAPRLGIFKKGRALGFSPEEVGFAAREGTIDFNKAGATLKKVNMWIPFLNANIQGRIGTITALKDRPMRSAMVIGSLAVIPGIATYLHNRENHSDLYDDIPQEIKDNYFTWIYGETTDDRGYRVPKYYAFTKGDMGQMFYNPIEYGLDWAYKNGDEKSVMEFATNWASNMSPIEFAREGKVSAEKAASGLLPPFVKAPIEVSAGEQGRNFYFGTPMVPARLAKKAPEEQYIEEGSNKTPEIYVKLGRRLGVSPIKLQGFAGGMLAGVGRSGLSPAAMGESTIERFKKEVGGQHIRDAWDTISEAESGYETTRIRARRLLDDKKPASTRKAMTLIREWNREAGKYNRRLSKSLSYLKVQNPGKFIKSITIEPKDLENIVIEASGRKSDALKRRLGYPQ